MFSVVTGYISVLLYPVVIGTPYSKTKRYKHRISWLLWSCTWFPKLHCNEKAVQVWTCCLSRWHCHKRCQEAKEGLTQVYYYYSSNYTARRFLLCGHLHVACTKIFQPKGNTWEWLIRKYLVPRFSKTFSRPCIFFCFFTNWDLYELQHSVKSYWGDKKLFWEF